MCIIYADKNKCYHFDSFQDWCEECLEDWFEIIGEGN
jgi:hypothetical protein